MVLNTYLVRDPEQRHPDPTTNVKTAGLAGVRCAEGSKNECSAASEERRRGHGANARPPKSRLRPLALQTLRGYKLLGINVRLFRSNGMVNPFGLWGLRGEKGLM